MITVDSPYNGPPLMVNASVRGVAVYLDTYAISDLAEGNPARRAKFVASLHSGADVLFSVANAIELVGPQGKSLEAVGSFLEEIGPYWCPFEMDPLAGIIVEGRFSDLPEVVPVSKDLLRAFVEDRRAAFHGRIIDLSSDFFSLRSLVEWLNPHGESLRVDKAAIDDVIIGGIKRLRNKFEQDNAWLDTVFPVVPFDQSRRRRFTFQNLMRNLVLEAKTYPLKKGDGVDFFHANIAATFANFATLDKHWKRRIEALPKPNGLARIYYAGELDDLVSDIEVAMKYLGK